MDVWHPRARRASAPFDGGAHMFGVPWRQVVHTVEGDDYTPSLVDYYGHDNWPHATIAPSGIWQHLPLDRAARALRRRGVDTNRARAIQVEVCWWADRIDALPDDLAALLVDWLTWVAAQTGAPLVGPAFVGADARPAGSRASQRFTEGEWLRFAGVCGHQHVPDNDHWDPGGLRLMRLLASHIPQLQEDLDVSFPTGTLHPGEDLRLHCPVVGGAGGVKEAWLGLSNDDGGEAHVRVAVLIKRRWPHVEEAIVPERDEYPVVLPEGTHGFRLTHMGGPPVGYGGEARR